MRCVIATQVHVADIAAAACSISVNLDNQITKEMLRRAAGVEISANQSDDRRASHQGASA